MNNKIKMPIRKSYRKTLDELLAEQRALSGRILQAAVDEGWPNAKIAKQLGVSSSTVYSYVGADKDRLVIKKIGRKTKNSSCRKTVSMKNRPNDKFSSPRSMKLIGGGRVINIHIGD